jgi:peptidoglycan hydrolase-like protein with peptidoglycan-binding domain
VEVQKLINAYGGYKPKIGAYVSLPLKLTEDGIYGNNTEWAVEQYIGKKTIDSRADTLNLEQKMIENQQKNNSFFPIF